jgi:alpha-mannosidase
VLSRGSREYENLARGGRSELAVTLFRSVGWLSRADLVSRSGHAGMDIPTPGAQEQGRLTFEYAVTTRGGEGVRLPDEWEDYRSPAEVVAHASGGPTGGASASGDASASGGASVPEKSFLDIQGAGITFSSLTRAPPGRLRLRFFEHAGKGGTAVLRFHARLRSASRTRIDGTKLADLSLADDASSVAVEVRPFQIVTVELEPAG